MKTELSAWALACAGLALSAGCGRSHVYTLETVAETSRGSGGTSSGVSGGPTSGGSATSGRTSGRTSSGASGSTSGQSGTSGGDGTSGGTSGGCKKGGPPAEFAPCANDSDCDCPLQCVPDPSGQGRCVRPCESISDCPLLYTTCQAGNCQPNLCGGLAGPPNGTLDGTCDVVGLNDGSCVPMFFGTGIVGLCYQGGGAIQACDPTATRSTLVSACSAHLVCLPAGASGQCETLCNPAISPTTCPGAGPCVEPLSSDPDLGICEPGGSSSGGSSGSSSGGTTNGGSGSSGGNGGTSGGLTGGSNGGSSGGSTGCPSPVPPSEFSACQTQDDCGCPLECAFDAWAGGRVCEYPCQQTGQCADLVTVCTSQGVCQINPCGQGTNNGTFDLTCDVLGQNDGTCLPLTPDGGASIGYCSQGGTSTSDCDPVGTRNDLSRVCPAGQYCFGGAVTFGGTCNAICDPNAGSGCPTGQFCSFIVNEPDLGVCITNSGF